MWHSFQIHDIMNSCSDDLQKYPYFKQKKVRKSLRLNRARFLLTLGAKVRIQVIPSLSMTRYYLDRYPGKMRRYFSDDQISLSRHHRMRNPILALFVRWFCNQCLDTEVLREWESVVLEIIRDSDIFLEPGYVRQTFYLRWSLSTFEESNKCCNLWYDWRWRIFLLGIVASNNAWNNWLQCWLHIWYSSCSYIGTEIILLSVPPRSHIAGGGLDTLFAWLRDDGRFKVSLKAFITKSTCLMNKYVLEREKGNEMQYFDSFNLNCYVILALPFLNINSKSESVEL